MLESQPLSSEKSGSQPASFKMLDSQPQNSVLPRTRPASLGTLESQRWSFVMPISHLRSFLLLASAGGAAAQLKGAEWFGDAGLAAIESGATRLKGHAGKF